MDEVAAVIPVFNRANQLVRALESVRDQTRAVSECVVVDDGSENCLSDARQFLEEFFPEGIWIVFPENRGVAAARNAGVAATSAKWICFLDSDDVWLPTKLEKQLAWHEVNPACRISQVEEAWIRDGAPVKKPKGWQPPHGKIFPTAVERCAISPSAVMMRRDLWAEHGGFDEEFRVCEDYELWLRIALREEVGLVNQGCPLIEKHAGHSDQLSLARAMDRHRVAILIRFLSERGSALSTEERSLVRQAIREKASIVATGGEKRGMEERAVLFRAIADAAGRDGQDLRDFYDSILEEINSSGLSSPA